MCLKINMKQTDRVADELKSGKKVKFWKVFKIRNIDGEDFICSPIKHSRYSPVISRRGVFHSNRKSNKMTSKEKKCGEIDLGIHVFYSRTAARDFVEPGEIILPVYVSANDFVAASVDDLNLKPDHCVFTKVRLDRKDLAGFSNMKKKVQLWN